jgi:hypothetical protein
LLKNSNLNIHNENLNINEKIDNYNDANNNADKKMENNFEKNDIQDIRFLFSAINIYSENNSLNFNFLKNNEFKNLNIEQV